MVPIKLSDADREKYGGPEWLDTDAAVSWLLEIPFAEQIAIERQMVAVTGINVLTFIAADAWELTLTSLGLRAWLALRREGIDIALNDFAPNVPGMDYAKSSPDAVPPPDGADSTPSPNTKATSSPKPSRASARRTASSTRGSGKRTA